MVGMMFLGNVYGRLCKVANASSRLNHAAHIRVNRGIGFVDTARSCERILSPFWWMIRMRTTRRFGIMFAAKAAPLEDLIIGRVFWTDFLVKSVLIFNTFGRIYDSTTVKRNPSGKIS